MVWIESSCWKFLLTLENEGDEVRFSLSLVCGEEGLLSFFPPKVVFEVNGLLLDFLGELDSVNNNCNPKTLSTVEVSLRLFGVRLRTVLCYICICIMISYLFMLACQMKVCTEKLCSLLADIVLSLSLSLSLCVCVCVCVTCCFCDDFSARNCVVWITLFYCFLCIFWLSLSLVLIQFSF